MRDKSYMSPISTLSSTICLPNGCVISQWHHRFGPDICSLSTEFGKAFSPGSWLLVCDYQMIYSRHDTLPETNIAPENRYSQKESGFPTTIFKGGYVSFRVCTYNFAAALIVCKCRMLMIIAYSGFKKWVVWPWLVVCASLMNLVLEWCPSISSWYHIHLPSCQAHAHLQLQSKQPPATELHQTTVSLVCLVSIWSESDDNLPHEIQIPNVLLLPFPNNHSAPSVPSSVLKGCDMVYLKKQRFNAKVIHTHVYVHMFIRDI